MKPKFYVAIVIAAMAIAVVFDFGLSAIFPKMDEGHAAIFAGILFIVLAVAFSKLFGSDGSR